MKRALRILVGIPLSPFMALVGTWVWLFNDHEYSWWDSIGRACFYMLIGDWDKIED